MYREKFVLMFKSKSKSITSGYFDVYQYNHEVVNYS